MIADRPSLLTWLASHDPLAVVPLDDLVVETAGHDPRSPYAETYWTGCLGPTAILLLRRLAGWLEESAEGFPLPLAPLARELGLGEGTGRNSPVVRSLARIVEFNMAQVRGDTLAVRRALPRWRAGTSIGFPATSSRATGPSSSAGIHWSRWAAGEHRCRGRPLRGK